MFVQLSGFFPHALLLPEGAGAPDELWVIGVEATASTTSLRSYRDSDGDGYVDAGTEAILFSGTRPDIVGSCSFDPVSGTLYLLERGSINIYRARDTNGDRRPDILDSQPFVEGSWPGPPGGPLGDDPIFGEEPHPVTGEPFMFPAGLTTLGGAWLFDSQPTSVRLKNIGQLIDLSGDGVADAFVAEAVDTSPGITDTPLVDGLIRIRVFGSDGSNVELREVDASGQVLEVLGSAVTQGGSSLVELATAIDEGMLLTTHDTTTNRAGPVESVLAKAARVEVPGPVTLDPSEAATLSIVGANLDLVDKVVLRLISQDGVGPEDLELTFEVSPGSRSIDVDIPILGEEWEGHGCILFQEPPEGGGGADDFPLALWKPEAGAGGD